MSSLADLSRRRRRRKGEVDTSLRLWEKPSLAPIEVGCRKFRRQTSAPPSDSAVLVRLFQASTVLHVMCYPIPVVLTLGSIRSPWGGRRKGKREEGKANGGALIQAKTDGRRSVMGIELAVYRE